MIRPNLRWSRLLAVVIVISLVGHLCVGVVV